MDYFCMNTNVKEAKDNPLIGMIDLTTADTYVRATSKKRLCQGGELD